MPAARRLDGGARIAGTLRKIAGHRRRQFSLKKNSTSPIPLESAARRSAPRLPDSHLAIRAGAGRAPIL